MPETQTTNPRSSAGGTRARKPQPLIRSVLALRIAVAAITTLSLGGMTAYAGSHVYTSSAPLVVAFADDSASSAAATATVTPATSVTTVTSSVRTSTATPVTATRQS
ncbi:MAG: hypothetical protein M3P38_04025 [Chloroflexota bacterium]|nr:hypothetical protein [Chloroflexota bacterium]